MKTLILFTIMFASSAQAEVRKYHTDIKICQNLVFDNGQMSIDFQGWHGVIPLREQTSDTRTIQSDWQYLTCEVKGDNLTIVATIPEEVYPLTQVPETATCTTTDTLGNTHILRVHPILLDSSDMSCWTSQDAWYASTPTMIYSGPDSGGRKFLPLLSGHNFVDGTYPAKTDDGTTRADITCEVRDNGTMMSVIYTDEAEEGSCYCAVQDGTAGTAKIPFQLERIY